MLHIQCDINILLLIEKCEKKKFFTLPYKTLFLFNKNFINFRIEKFTQAAYMHKNIVFTESLNTLSTSSNLSQNICFCHYI